MMVRYIFIPPPVFPLHHMMLIDLNVRQLSLATENSLLKYKGDSDGK